MNSTHAHASADDVSRIPYKIKKLCESVRNELLKLRQGHFSETSLKLQSMRLLRLASESSTLSAAKGLLINLSDVLLVHGSGKEDLTTVIESLVHEILIRFDADKYRFVVIQSPQDEKSSYHPNYLSQRMQQACLIPSVKESMRDRRTSRASWEFEKLRKR